VVLAIRINQIVPDFSAKTDIGHIKFHNWIGDGWIIMFSHPRDFTGVCTTEMSAVAKMSQQWAERNTKVIGVSADGTEIHVSWKHDIETLACQPAKFPIISDHNSELAKMFEMLPEEAFEPNGSLKENARTVRSLFIIGPDKRLKLSMFYPSNVGRNWSEILRALDALQSAAKHSVAMPANWELGEDVIIPSVISDEDAKIKFGEVKAVLPYVRTTKLPDK
jgi:alkyl hydroperoxide reductase subunit AhpC